MIIFEWGNIFRVCRMRRIMRKEGGHWKEKERERTVCSEELCERGPQVMPKGEGGELEREREQEREGKGRRERM